MRADFYLDPACPWTWTTSRWLCEVSDHRPVTVRWRPYSLLLDDTLADIPLTRRLELASSTRALRVMEAVRDRYGDAPIGELYTRMGVGFHHDGRREFDHLPSVLAAMDLDPSIIDALDDPHWDSHIRAAMDEAHLLAGPRAGVPLLAITADGPPRAFLGPVFSPAPTGIAALAAWDGLMTVLAVPGFFELKRHRTGEPILPQRPEVSDGAAVVDLTAG